jgi:methylenetetrahydrofolate dehydrogenase (NADP+)/methenyltetrahydrofolate cyclohydrolase
MLIDGKTIASQIQNEIRNSVATLSERKPCLAVILVGEHPPSQIYVTRKAKACEEVGILSLRHTFPSTLSEAELLKEIDRLNQDTSVDGILVQLPLPKHLNPLKITQHITPSKDVDGLHPMNVGKLLMGDPNAFAPCTPLGIQVMLERSGVETAGKHVVIIGRSNLVGKPMAALLMQNAQGANATVTVAHSATKGLKDICLTADILIAAMGNPRFITADMVKENAIVIDVGINSVPNPDKPGANKLVGDVDFDAVSKKCALITPVPGGVGPMTIAMLLSNTLKSYVARSKITLE